MRISINRRRSGGGHVLVSAVSVVFLLVLIVYPLITLFGQMVFPHVFDYVQSWRFSVRPLVQVFSEHDNVTSIFNSLGLGLGGAMLSALFGTVTAVATTRTSRVIRVALQSIVWVVFFTPSYIVAEGWVMFMQDSGVAAQLLHLPNGWSGWFFSPGGVALLLGLRYFPYVHFSMYPAIQNVGPEMLVAGRMLGARKLTVLVKIWLPLLIPGLLAGASLAFAEGFGDYGLAAAIAPQMQLPLISYQIEVAMNQAPVNYAAAAVLSLLTVVVIALALWLQFWWLKRRSFATISSASRSGSTPPRRSSMLPILGVILSGLAVIVPVGAATCASLWKNPVNGMQASNWTLRNYVQALQVGSDGLTSLLRSFGYSATAAIVTAVLGLLFAYQISFRKNTANGMLNGLTMSTIAVPGIVLAAGFVFAWNATWLIPVHLILYGTPACLALCYIAGSLPYAIRLQLGAMTQLAPNMMFAARMLGARERRTVFRIVLPLVRETVITTFFITFTGTMFELPASSLLYPPGQPPFPVTIASKFDAFEWSQGSALAIMGMIIVLGIYFIGVAILNRPVPAGIRQQGRPGEDTETLRSEAIGISSIAAP